MAHSQVDLLGDGFDEDQVQQAIRQSLACTDLQPPKVQQTPSLLEEDDLQRALAESMRTFEAEQQAGQQAGRKRSSSGEQNDSEQPYQQQQQDHTSTMQQQAEGQQPGVGGALKRQRSISTPHHGSTGLDHLTGAQQPMPAQGRSGRLGRLQGGVIITTPLQNHQQQEQQQPQQQGLGVLPLQHVQRSSSITNAAAGRLRPWPSHGILRPQQQGWGMRRSASTQDLQAAAAHAEPTGSDDGLPGSRPSSPAAAGQRQHQEQHQQDRAHSGSMLDMQDLDADGEEDLYMDVPNSDSSMSSGRPQTISSWGPGLLQIAPAPVQPAPRRIGPGPVPGDPSEWCIHDRRFYEGQPILWQQFRNGESYAGKILTVEGGAAGSPALYTAEIYGHPSGLRYVEASSAQLQPQLRINDLVWCKPAAVRAACWGDKGPLYLELYPPHIYPPGQTVHARPQPCETAKWMLGLVQQVQPFSHNNPVVELRILSTGGKDSCWFRNAQLELMREMGESSAAAEKRARGAAGAGDQAAAVAAAAAAAAAGGGFLAGQQEGGDDDDDDGPPDLIDEIDLLADEEQQQSQQQQSQQQQPQQVGHDDDALLELAAAAGDDPDDYDLGEADAGDAAEPSQQHQQQEVIEQGGGAVGDSVEPAGDSDEGAAASPDPAADAAPSLLSKPAAALTGESELDAAAATAVTVEQGAGAAADRTQAQGAAAGAVQSSPAAAGKGSSQQQQQLVLEGSGESAEIGAAEVVMDSCAGVGVEAADAAAAKAAQGGAEGEGPVPSPKEGGLSNQHSGVDDNSTRLGHEGFGET